MQLTRKSFSRHGHRSYVSLDVDNDGSTLADVRWGNDVNPLVPAETPKRRLIFLPLLRC